MRQIWKYELKPGKNDFNFRNGSEIISVAVQYNKPVLYVSVNTDEMEMVPVMIRCRMTGEPFEPEKGERYIGTMIMDNEMLGSFVLHAFFVPQGEKDEEKTE